MIIPITCSCRWRLGGETLRFYITCICTSCKQPIQHFSEALFDCSFILLQRAIMFKSNINTQYVYSKIY